MRVPAQTLAATRALQAPNPGALGTRRPSLPAASPSLTLSRSAEALLSAQSEAAAPRVRPDVVASIRAELAAGTLGSPADIAATIDGLLRDLA